MHRPTLLLAAASLSLASLHAAPHTLKFNFEQAKLYPGTTREITVHVPDAPAPDKGYPVMVFQDGVQYGAPGVFDKLIAEKKLPPIVGVFITPGRIPAPDKNSLDRFNRSYEYDNISDTYARFVAEEVLPEVALRAKVKLSDNPDDRGLGGQSSGGICAYNAAFQRPDLFRRVFCGIGTFVNIRGGDSLPKLVRLQEAKPVRVFLVDGSADQNIYAGDWWMANQMMERALVFSGYEVRHDWGDGGHEGKHAGRVFPEAVQWLWEGWPAGLRANPENKSKAPVAALLGDSPWEKVGEGYGFTEGPAVAPDGGIFFSDIPASKIHHLGSDGKLSVFAENTNRANGLMFGPDGRLYACASGAKQVTAYTADGKASVVAEGIEGNDLAVSAKGDIYVTEPSAKKVWLVRKDGAKQVVDEGISRPNGVLFTPDQSQLIVADSAGVYLWIFTVKPDGTLANKQKYHYLHIRDGLTSSSADGMTVDTEGRLYVATSYGIQFLDQAGRVNGMFSTPNDKVSNLVFGGPERDILYATCGDMVFKRRLKAKGVNSFEAPVLPPKPRL